MDDDKVCAEKLFWLKALKEQAFLFRIMIDLFDQLLSISDFFELIQEYTKNLATYIRTSSSHFVLIFSKWKKYHRSTSIPTLQAVVSRDSTSRGLIGQSDHNCQKTFGTK